MTKISDVKVIASIFFTLFIAEVSKFIWTNGGTMGLTR